MSSFYILFYARALEKKNDIRHFPLEFFLLFHPPSQLFSSRSEFDPDSLSLTAFERKQRRNINFNYTRKMPHTYYEYPPLIHTRLMAAADEFVFHLRSFSRIASVLILELKSVREYNYSVSYLAGFAQSISVYTLRSRYTISS